MIEIETPRLLLREIQERDKADMFEICSDEQGCLDDGGFHAYREMDERFDNLFRLFLEQKRYAIVLKEEDKAIGIFHLMEVDRALNTYEIGFNINPNYRQKGYCYEAVSHVIRTWFEKTDVEMFLARHYPYNTASKNLIKKLGFIYEGRQHKADCHVVYGPLDFECYYLEKQV